MGWVGVCTPLSRVVMYWASPGLVCLGAQRLLRCIIFLKHMLMDADGCTCSCTRWLAAADAAPAGTQACRDQLPDWSIDSCLTARCVIFFVCVWTRSVYSGCLSVSLPGHS
jgi:hypothetical protein